MTSQEKHRSIVASDGPEPSDPAVNSDALPDDHPIYLFPEAKTYYGSREPPFVLKKRSELLRTVVIPTKNGLRPQEDKATKVNLKAKPWDKELFFWTLDLNGKRYIVKAFNGGAQGGMRYLYWAGPRKDFEQKPLALSFIAPSQSGPAISSKGDKILPNRSQFAPVNGKRSLSASHSDSSDSSDTSDSEVDEQSRVPSGYTQRVADPKSENLSRHTDENSSDHHTGNANTSKEVAAFQSAPGKRRKTDVSSREIDQLYRVSPPLPRRSDVHDPLKEHQPESPPPTSSTSKDPVNDEEKRKQAVTARIEKALNRKFDQIFTPWAGEDQDVSRNTLQSIWKVIRLMDENSPQKISRTLNQALNDGDGRRQSAGGKKPTSPCFKRLATKLEETKDAGVNGDGLETSSSPSEDDHKALDPRRLQRPEAVKARSVQPAPRSAPLDSNRHQRDVGLDVDTLPSISLPRQKQIRTTLIVRVAPSSEYIPLRLSECMTPGAFYNKVLGAWEIDKESVAKMTVTFTWMDPIDKMRTMAMNSQVEGCFAHLVELVDEAPSWTDAPEGKGKCVLEVEIMLKE